MVKNWKRAFSILAKKGRDTRDIRELSLLCMSEIVVFYHRKSPESYQVHTDIGHTEADQRLKNVFNQKSEIIQIFFY